MTLNIAIATSQYIICATDRRLTRLTGQIHSERSNKLTAFECMGAKGLITYTGVGLDRQGQTPNDWLADIDLRGKRFGDLLDTIKLMANQKIATFPNSPIPHSFIISAFVQTHYLNFSPIVAMVSNYDTLEKGKAVRSAELNFRTEFVAPSRQAGSVPPICIVVTGAEHLVRKKWTAHIRNEIIRGRTPERVRGRAIKIIRDTAYSAKRLGTVGTSVNSGILRPNGDLVLDENVPGGSKLMEGANILTPNFKMKDFYAYGGQENPLFGRYDRRTNRIVVSEPKCPNCKTPMPAAYQKCGVCDYSLASNS